MLYVFEVSYDGTEYSGWQKQNNAVSVQEKIEEAIFVALGVKHNVIASGRTDAGVHALGQVCQFEADDITVPPEKLPSCLNKVLPKDIKLVKGYEGKTGFDCNRSAKQKTYKYSLYVSSHDVPVLERYAVRVENLADAETLKNYAKFFEGEHDYKAFCASGSSVKTTVRTVYEVKIEEEYFGNVRMVNVYVTGNGFLYNMVRTMIGELLDLTSMRRTKESLQKAFETGERTLVGKTMPAKGLTLMNVKYEGV